MLKNKDIVILKGGLEKIEYDVFCIGQIYSESPDGSEYKVDLLIGGNSGFYEWFGKESLLLLSEVVEEFYIRDIRKASKKQLYFIYNRYLEYLKKQQ